MHIIGRAWLARRRLVVEKIGDQEWQRFVQELAAEQPAFADPIDDDTKIPIEPFLAFCDRLVERYYEGDERAHWDFGEASARLAFGPGGPLERLLESQAVEEFLHTVPALWNAYYDQGRVLVDWIDSLRVGDVRLVEVPLHHVHFEYSVMGYLCQSLDLLGAKVGLMRTLSCFAAGDPEVHYQLHID